jgi:sucrose-phosphate synthase
MGLVVLHLHLHGLLRGHDPELGRDPDTGGQTLYVLELARALAERSEVERVEVLTRRIVDPAVSPDYAEPEERLGPRLWIRRLPFGPRFYLPKEELWPHLDELVSSLAAFLLAAPRLPDWIHAHYADAGYVGARLHQRLGVPLLFTAHSLGREKRRLLLSSGHDPSTIESRYALERRIEAEELALSQASLVVTSTLQELEKQYAHYARFRPERARVIPPGVDARCFYPPRPGVQEQGPGSGLQAHLQTQLQDPHRAPLLAICRPDRRKNIPSLLEAFSRSRILQSHHNLVLVMGNPAAGLSCGGEMGEVLADVEGWLRHPALRGRVALPNQLRREKIPALYRWAARLGGVFVNPALTEPFGLTLLEAAASGLPVVATDDGGPRDILRQCRNGLLVDVTHPDALRLALERSFADPGRWQQWSRNGLEAVARLYGWEAHGATYLKEVTAVIRCQREWRESPIPVLLPRGLLAPAQLGGVSPLPLGWCVFEAGIQ